MAGTLSRTMPTPELVKNMVHGSGATGTLLAHWNSVRLPFNATSTGSANMAWINPENGTVLARPYLCWTTAGTGTFDMGLTDDGTGNVANMIDGGTMTVGVHWPSNVGSSTLGGVGGAGGTLVGPGGTGTNNSICVVVTDTITSTAAGFLIVEYLKVQA